ncbi:flagellin [Mobiluncus porci]|uniref:Flagellin n=1 Tax=Mobiluncus porci TaxID=2652278 RepID=A0A7K0K5G3_9ACTO|nr:flagellin [Mobiluncus porci]MST50676.1 flagellin [Mobiluncus porci]
MTTLAVDGSVAVPVTASDFALPISSDSPSSPPPPPVPTVPLDSGPGYSLDVSGMPSHLAYALGSLGSSFADGAGAGLASNYRVVSGRFPASSGSSVVSVSSSNAGGPVSLGSVLGNTFGLATAGAAGAAQSVNTNVMALNAYRHVASAHQILNDSLQKLSSGKRINTAADDAAGLAMAENMRSQMLGSKQAIRNAQDGISMVQTADGVLGTVHSMLQRMRVLAVQGANDSNGTAERGNIAIEMDAIRHEIGRIGEVTEVLGRKILGDKYVEPADALRIQIGSNATDMETIAVTFVDVVDIAKEQLCYIPQDADNAAFQGAIRNIDGQIEVISSARATLGSVMSRFEHTINTLNVTVENLSSAQGRIEDSDVALDASRYMRGRILTQTSHAMLSQAMVAPRGVLSLLSVA